MNEALTISSSIDDATNAITMVKEELQPIKNKAVERLIFRSRAKWTEVGKKLTRYFLNL